MKQNYIFLIGIILLFSIHGNAQQRAIGSSINVEFSGIINNLSTPALMPGFFYQFPIGKRLALSSIFSFGKSKFLSREISEGTSGPITTITQYYESTTAFEQSLKNYFLKRSNKNSSRFYWGLGYSLKYPKVQRGEKKWSRADSSPNYFRKKDLPKQQKLNLVFGVDYFLENKFFFSMEAGFQTPLFSEEYQELPILASGDMLFLNMKIGIRLHKLVYSPREKREKIHIKDLEIKN